MESGESRDDKRPERDGGNRNRRPPGGPPPGRGRAPGAPPGPPEPWAGPARSDDGRRKGSIAGRYAGWGDDLERVVCARIVPAPPPGFPTVGRHDVATLPLRQVASRAGQVLLCDGHHPGPHLWAEGEPASEPGATSAVAQSGADDNTPATAGDSRES